MGEHKDPLRSELFEYYQREGAQDYQGRLYQASDWVHLTLKSTVLGLLTETMPEGACLLDAGCAEGLYLREIPHRFRCGVGVVISLPKLQRGMHLAENLKCVFFIVGDLTHLPLRDGVFDTVLAIETVEHVPNLSDSLRELTRVLRPGGVLICSVPTEKDEWLGEAKRHADWHEKSGHLHSFSRNEFRAQLEAAGISVLQQVVFDILGPQIRHRLANSPLGHWVRRVIVNVARSHQSPTECARPDDSADGGYIGARLWPAVDRILRHAILINRHGSLCLYLGIKRMEPR